MMDAMGQLSRRNDDRSAMTSVAGSKVWLESCSVCGRPVTIVAATKPADPHCSECPTAVPQAEGTPE
jgi:hypothetical protein